jgi:hypothetical protein
MTNNIKEQISNMIFNGITSISIKKDNEIMEIIIYENENGIYYKNTNKIYYYTFINTLMNDHITDNCILL